MTKATRTVLEVRVEGVNLANAEANRLRPLLVEAMRPFVGQKVIRQAGGLMDKVSKIVEPLLKTDDRRLHIYRSSSSLMWYVKTCVNINGIAYYHESPVYVGDLRGGILEKVIDDYEPMRTDFSAAEITEAREAYKLAKEAADKAQSKLFPFGEYDR